MQHTTKLRTQIACALLPLAWFGVSSSASAGGLCDGLPQAECRAIASRNVHVLLANNVIAQVYGSKVLCERWIWRHAISVSDVEKVWDELFNALQGSMSAA